MKRKIIFGFHALIARIKQDATSIEEIYIDTERHDKRMQDFLEIAKTANVCVISTSKKYLSNIVCHHCHQGVAAKVNKLSIAPNLTELLCNIKSPMLFLILDSITDPHNLGACLRVADGAGVHAVIAPKDRAVRLTGVAAKVASGAVETTPYLMVTNLARTMRDLKDHGVYLIGMSEDAEEDFYASNLTGSIGLVLGSENNGMRRLTRETCNILVKIPMFGFVKNLNVSVASGICLYEAQRQRLFQ